MPLRSYFKIAREGGTEKKKGGRRVLWPIPKKKGKKDLTLRFQLHCARGRGKRGLGGKKKGGKEGFPFSNLRTSVFFIETWEKKQKERRKGGSKQKARVKGSGGGGGRKGKKKKKKRKNSRWDC